jgi:hypothetical protein
LRRKLAAAELFTLAAAAVYCGSINGEEKGASVGSSCEWPKRRARTERHRGFVLRR